MLKVDFVKTRLLGEEMKINSSQESDEYQNIEEASEPHENQQEKSDFQAQCPRKMFESGQSNYRCAYRGFHGSSRVNREKNSEQ